MAYRDAAGAKNTSRDTGGSAPGGAKPHGGFRDAEGAVNRSRKVGSGDPDVAIPRGYVDPGVGGGNRSRSSAGNSKRTNKGSSGEGGN